MSEEKCTVLQPEDIKRILSLNDSQYEIVVRSWRFLFDFMYAMPDETQIISHTVKMTKCNEIYCLVEDQDQRQLSLKFDESVNDDLLFDEFVDLIKSTNIIKLPTV